MNTEKMKRSAREHGMDLEDAPVAYEFYNPATGHAIVDYTRWTHAGHLTEEGGYEARPLTYAPRKVLSDDEIDRCLAETLCAIAARKGLAWNEIRTDIATHNTLRREFARAVIAKAAGPEPA